MTIDERLRHSSDQLRSSIDELAIPEFSEPGLRRATPVVVAAVVAVIGLASWLLLADDQSATTEVATQTPSTLAPSIDLESPAEPAIDAGTLVTDRTPRAVLPMERPDSDLVQEPSFGVGVSRLTAAAPGGSSTPVFSGTQAFNSDGSLLLLYQRDEDRVGHVVMDVASRTTTALDIEPTDVEQLAWDPVDPSVLWFVSAAGARVVAVDVVTGTERRSIAVDGCADLHVGANGGTPSSGGDLLGLRCQSDAGPRLVAVDLSSGAVTQASPPDGAGDWSLAPFASGTGFVIVADDRILILDRSLRPTPQSPIDLSLSSSTVTRDTTGRDVLVGTSFDADLPGLVVSVDLATGRTTVVIGPDAGDPYPASGSEVGMAALGTGALVPVVVGASTPAGGQADPGLGGEIGLVDVSNQVHYRLAHHRSSGSGAHSAWSDPIVAVSPSGDLVVFSSDWGTDTVDTFAVAIPQS